MTQSFQFGKLFFALCLLIVLYIFYRILEPFLIPLILGLTLVSLFYPNYQDLNRRLGEYSNFSSLIMCTIVTLLLILPLLLFSLALFEEFNSAYADYQLQIGSDEGSGIWTEYPLLGELRTFVNETLGLDEARLQSGFSAILDRLAQYLLDHYSSILGGVGAFVVKFFIMIFSMFFFFRDGEFFLTEARKLIPLAPQYKDLVLNRLKEVTYATFFGIFATGICQGIAAGLIFYLLGISNPILWGTATAFFSLVPIVGTAAVWVPMSVYLVLQGFVFKGILLLILGSTVIGMVDNFLRPLIIEGKSSGMHLLLVFLSLIGGLVYFGPSGLILGPLAAALLVTFLEIYKIEFRDELG